MDYSSTRYGVMFLLVLSCLYGSAQKEYRKYRQALPGLNCKDSLQFEYARHNIPLLEQWIENHPKHYAAHHDLALEYFVMCFADSSAKDLWAAKSISSSLRFVSTAPRKMKYHGYWNNAIVKSWLNDCAEAIDYLNKSKKLFHYPEKYWDTETETGIRKDCGQ